MQRADGGVASGLLLFTATPQSIRLAAYCQLPGRGAFWVRFTSSYIKPALKGEVDASATSRRRGCIGAALIYGNPSVNPPCGVLPAPRPGSLLGCDTICQDIRVNAQVGTRSPYSLPFVILPVPARSPFRLLVHRMRSTPNPIDKPPFSGL